MDSATTVDVAVLGAGPAGLSAAAAAAEHGRSVAVFDEGEAPGGRLVGQLHRERDGRWKVGRDEAERLRDRALGAGATIVAGVSAWAVEPGWSVYLRGDGAAPRVCHARALVVATGAGELAAPLPGWTLPGAITPGAAQVLVNVHGVLPGRRALIAGTDALGLEAAQLLEVVGASVVGVHPVAGVDGAAEPPAAALRRLVGTVGAAAPSPLLRAGGRLARGRVVARAAVPLLPRRVAGVPLRLREAVTALRGDGRVEEAELAAVGADGRLGEARRTVAIDLACVGGGLRPLVELLAGSGCELVALPGLGGVVPLHGPDQQTTAPRAFVAGGVTGVEGAAVCAAQGTVAGLAAALAAGAPPAVRRELAPARARVARRRAEATVRFHPELEPARARMRTMWEARCASA
ncbi:FAD-dependent oxidoreductase [Conexibacter arvalis]|uniref:Sarcosine oxidase subunit alpha n=1 Tax=Conexibacter arvalis TaxID=912552 RepID=A0A840I9H2_9ACTN|nr:FAD-dependent oxidoreductase [Conexibacter arvalis]MBB4660580.1 sarcosine oxidase subunit alpha [Conexibacter arvalis]